MDTVPHQESSLKEAEILREKSTNVIEPNRPVVNKEDKNESNNSKLESNYEQKDD